MQIEVDQSGKVEDTARPTIIALANDKQKTIMIKATLKRKLLKLYREAGKPKMYTLQLFSALVYLLLEKSKIEQINLTIDIEYKDQDALIKSYILQTARARGKIDLEPEDISFRQIGKKSLAHKAAIEAFRKKKADFEAKEEEILALVLGI